MMCITERARRYLSDTRSDEAARIAKPDTKDKHRHVVGMPVVSIKIGDNCYHGLCDVGSIVSDDPQV